MLCTEPTYILVVMARRKHPVCVHAYNIAQITARGGTNMHYVDWRVMFLVVGGFNRACGMQIPTWGSSRWFTPVSNQLQAAIVIAAQKLSMLKNWTHFCAASVRVSSTN